MTGILLIITGIAMLIYRRKFLRMQRSRKWAKKILDKIENSCKEVYK